ncbi:hypothetical protein PAHAL_3G260800 [Panicum hallii]|uniref:Uncharacterized protein n=1 Tax=Panicum hallii TaxID=206008 RepID=A0A2S3HBM2_9POAL|nr:hypothetical protein PAHAL_3G260800 [Panicum hallii]
MHRGHPARIIGAPAASGLPSDDTHELGGDAVEDDDDDSRLGEAPPPPPTPTPPPWPVAPPDDGPPRDRDRLSRSSCSFDPTLPLFLLIFRSTIKPCRALTTTQQPRACAPSSWSAVAGAAGVEAGQASSQLGGVCLGICGVVVQLRFVLYNERGLEEGVPQLRWRR